MKYPDNTEISRKEFGNKIILVLLLYITFWSFSSLLINNSISKKVSSIRTMNQIFIDDMYKKFQYRRNCNSIQKE